MMTPSDIWNVVRGRKTIVPSHGDILRENQVSPKDLGPNPIVPNMHYFGIVVDELFLSNSRKWTIEFEPMVLSITELSYAGAEVVLPFVIGPNLLGNKASMAPQGMLYKNTMVAGIHPFRGGRVASTVVLCQVQTKDWGSEILKIVESVSHTVPFSTELSTVTKFAGSVMEGVKCLFSMGETSPLVGIRQEFNHDLGDSVRPGYFVLIDGSETKFPREQLWVRDGSLQFGRSADASTPFRDASYVLFSIRGAEKLSDLTRLPDCKGAKTVIDLAASAEEANWKRAKAELVVLLRELLSSPDLTRDQALSYHQELVNEAKEAHQRAQSIGTLGPKGGSREDSVGVLYKNILEL